MANTYLTRTPSSAGNRRTWTISTWVKFSGDGDNVAIFNAWYADSNIGHFTFKRRSTNSQLGWSQWSLDNYTNASYRDVNGWYHIVLAVDTTQSTASNRQKLYVNGEQVTSFSTSYTLGLNEELPVNNNNIHTIGANKYSSIGNYFNGSMSHFHMIDGTAYDATAFGQYDANGVWTINTSPSVTYGTNGFFILKDGNSVTDQSGNGNNWTVGGGTLTNTEDSPSNVFNTFNGIRPTNETLSKGNTNAGSASASWQDITTALGASSGKFYTEFLCAGSATAFMHGVADLEYANYQGSHMGAGTGRVGYYHGGDVYVSGSAQAYGNSYAIGDYIGCALDMDNNKVYFSKNGVWQNSGDPTSGATGTGAISLPTTGTYGFGTSNKDDSTTRANFGNGYFGTTAVSSAGTNASGIGIFEYDVPTGYTALSTKGLNL